MYVFCPAGRRVLFWGLGYPLNNNVYLVVGKNDSSSRDQCFTMAFPANSWIRGPQDKGLEMPLIDSGPKGEELEMQVLYFLMTQGTRAMREPFFRRGQGLLAPPTAQV